MLWVPVFPFLRWWKLLGGLGGIQWGWHVWWWVLTSSFTNKISLATSCTLQDSGSRMVKPWIPSAFLIPVSFSGHFLFVFDLAPCSPASLTAMMSMLWSSMNWWISCTLSVLKPLSSTSPLFAFQEHAVRLTLALWLPFKALWILLAWLCLSPGSL